MSELSRKLHSWYALQGRTGLTWWCPGCKRIHSVSTYKGGWWWDGDTENPTITPAVLFQHDVYGRVHRCHSIIEKGIIRFYDDCTHSLAGQSVPLPEFP